MKKILMIALCLGLMPMLFAAQEDAIQKTGFFSESGARVRIMSETQFEAMVALQTEDSLYYYTSDPTANAIGFGSPLTWEGALRFTPTELAPYVGDEITAIWWYHYDGSSPAGRIIIYDNNTPVWPGAVLQQDPYTGMPTGWCRGDFSSNVTITGAGDLWASVEVQDPGSGFFPIGIDAGPAIDGKGDWIYDPSGGWEELQNYGLDYNWSLIAIVVSGGVTSHDVGTMAILAPGATEMPNTTLNPQATYRNYGDFTETFDVYFEIDSLGSLIYSQTANITRDPGMDTTITWPSWTTGPTNGTVYDITAYTVLSGDENPANDTLSQTCTIHSTFWEILDPPAFPAPTGGHSEATAHDGYYYVFGCGGGNNEVQVYDIANNTWTAGTNNPTGAAFYGTANYAVDKYYRIGGYNGTAAMNNVDIYDPTGSTWASGAAAPTLLIDHISGVYNDSLIYCLGGGNWFSSVTPNTGVYFYDVYSDAWTTATSFPGAGRGCLAGGIIDTFAIAACGYDGSAMRIDYVVGVIDPANPATIVWGSAATIPGIDSLYRMPSGVDPFNKELWITCGQKWTTQINQTFSYAVYTDTWTEWAFPKPQVVANMTPMAITTTTAGDLGLYVAGGHYAGSPMSDHEVFHTGKTTGIEEQPGQYTGPLTFGFAPNIPNPVSGYTAIQYTTTKSGKASLKVYDGLGRLVRTLVDRSIEPAGSKTVYWNGKDDARRDVANGVYFLKLDAQGETATQKMILVK